jgi:nucleotide-binding universal stress UspA family protein
MYKHILIPTDGSALSRRAIANGVKLAKSVGQGHRLVRRPARHPHGVQGLRAGGLHDAAEHAEMIEKTAAKYQRHRAGGQARGVRCQCIHATNDFPADAILAVAKRQKCDLIVMASHGRRGLAGVLLGSETQKVLTHSKIPVLVTR